MYILNRDEAQAILKVLAEADFAGIGEFARLSDEEEEAVRSAERKLRQQVNSENYSKNWQ